MRQLQKLTQVYRYLDGLYVDEVDMQPLVESAISGMLEDDPHSAYIGADEMKGVQEELRRGVQRHRRRIQHPARHGHRGQYDRRGPGRARRGAAQRPYRAHRHAGCRGFQADGLPKYLRGKTGTKVEIDVVRQGEPEPLHFVIVRDKIPLNTVDAAYMAADGVGYIKVNRFGRTTMPSSRGVPQAGNPGR